MNTVKHVAAKRMKQFGADYWVCIGFDEHREAIDQLLGWEPEWHSGVEVAENIKGGEVPSDTKSGNEVKLERNMDCPCGSRRQYKKCCGKRY